MKPNLWITNGVAVRFLSRLSSFPSHAFNGTRWGILFLVGSLAAESSNQSPISSLAEGSISTAQDFSLTEVVRVKDLVCMFDDTTLLWHRYSIEEGAYLDPVSVESPPETIYKKGDTYSVCCQYPDGLLTELNLETGVETDLFVLPESNGLVFTEDLVISSSNGITLYTYDGTPVEPGVAPSEEEMHMRFLSGENPLQLPNTDSLYELAIQGNPGEAVLNIQFSRSLLYPEQVFVEKSGDLIHWEPVSDPEEVILWNTEQGEFVRQRLSFSAGTEFYRLKYQMAPQ